MFLINQPQKPKDSHSFELWKFKKAHSGVAVIDEKNRTILHKAV